MVRLRDVDVHPGTGHWQRSWGDTPDDDALSRSAVSVARAYGRALEEVVIEHRVPAVRLLVGIGASFFVDTPPDLLAASILARRMEGWDCVNVRAPAGVAALGSKARQELVVTLVDAVLHEQARVHGWDVHAVREVSRLAARLRVDDVQASPWKASRTRAHEARARWRVADDGFARFRVEVRDRRTGEALGHGPVAVTPWGPNTSKRYARSLRWTGSESLDLDGRSFVVAGHAAVTRFEELTSDASLGPDDGVHEPGSQQAVVSFPVVVTVR